MKNKNLTIPIAVAAVLWFVMFSPWTKDFMSFWIMMPVSACTLTAMAITMGKDMKEDLEISPKMIALGIGLAATLWIVFYVGDKVSSLLFDFARPQVDEIYGMRDGTQKWIIGALLLLIIGPAEEIFWRGFIQRQISKKRGALQGMIITLIVYTLIHIWSLNFMLTMAAMTAGLIWGGLYWWKPKWLTALIVSHAVWDCVVFVVLPI